MLIDVEKMRLLKTQDPNMKFKLLKPNIERFFRDYIYYFNIYDRDEIIIDSGYLPYHYLDNQVLERVIGLLEKELGYNIIIVKTTNISKKGYQKGDLVNIRLFDRKTATTKEVDDYFNLKMFQPLYSSFHEYNNISKTEKKEVSYLSCADTKNNFLLGNSYEESSEQEEKEDTVVKNDNLKEDSFEQKIDEFKDKYSDYTSPYEDTYQSSYSAYNDYGYNDNLDLN